LTITWPSSLPQPTLSSFQEQLADNLVQTSFDSGPSEARVRGTAPTSTFSFIITLTEQQADTLRSFFSQTVRFGSLPFEMLVASTLYTFRFSSPPTFTPLGGSQYRASVQVIAVNSADVGELPADETAPLPFVRTDGSTPITASQQIDGNVGIGAAPLSGPAIKLFVSRSGGTAAIRVKSESSGQTATMQIESADASSILEFRRVNTTRWSFRSDGADTFALRDAALNNVLSIPQSGSITMSRATKVEDSLGIMQAGTERWRIAEDTGFLFIGSENTGFQPQMVIEDMAPVNTLRVAANGRVGINQPTPAFELHVVGSAAITGQLNMLGTEPILIPRLTSTQRDAIGSPVVSSIIFNLDTLSFQLFNGSSWTTLSANADESLHMQEPAAGDVANLITRSTDTITVAEVFAFTGAGTVNYTVKINGTNITGLVNQSATTSTRTTGRVATAANIVSAGSLLSVTVDSVSSAADFSLTLRGFRI